MSDRHRDNLSNGPNQDIGFLLIPGFSNLTFAAALEPLRLANTVCDAPFYTWRTFSADGQSVASSSDIPIPVNGDIFTAKPRHGLFVVASWGVEAHCTKKLASRLRDIARSGCVLTGLETGCFVLARAGLLDGYKATIHWEVLSDFTTRFPHVNVVPDRFVIDRRRCTAGGAIATLDLMLDIVRRDHGMKVALELAHRFIHSRSHPSIVPQIVDSLSFLAASHPKLADAIRLMEENIETPLPIESIAHKADIEMRTLQRLFQETLSCSPVWYYSNLRLQYGNRHLVYGDTKIAEIADICGYSSASAFARAYRQHFGHSPSSARRGH